MNLEPQQEAPRRQERKTKEQPSPAQLQQRADEELRSLRELFAKSEAELGEAHPELEKLKQEAEAAHAEFVKAVAKAEQLPLEPEQAQEQAERALYDVEATDDLERIADACSQSMELKGRVLEQWASELGKKSAERLLEDATYRREVADLSRKLREPLRPDAPAALPEAHLKNTIVLMETLGANAVELARANDLGSYASDLAFDMAEGQGAFFIDRSSVDAETGELTGDVQLSLAYKTANGEGADILRKFSRTKREDGSFEKLAEHTKFELPLSLQEGGIAAKALAGTLAQYEAMEMDAIELNANINVGGYAWAQYGFGYEEGKHSEADIENMGADYESSLSTVLQQLELAEPSYDEETGTMYLSFKDETLGARIAPLLEALKASRTPQETAAVGMDGPFFCRNKDGDWRLFEDRAEAKTYSDSLRTSGNEDKDYSGVMHAGKLALMNKLWRGRLELNRRGSQKGKNLGLLKAALARRLKTV